MCLPQEAETVRLVRKTVTDVLRLFGVQDDCVDDIRLAVSEACTNVIEHATSDDEYEVAIQVDDTHCAISVKNTADGFDARSLSGLMPDPDSARGRGVAIMNAVMDGVHFSSNPEAGTVVHLVRTLAVHEDGPLARLRYRH